MSEPSSSYTKIISKSLIRDFFATPLPDSRPQGIRSPNDLPWGQTADDFFHVYTSPRKTDIWSVSMLEELLGPAARTVLDYEGRVDNPKPTRMKPWPVLQLVESDSDKNCLKCSVLSHLECLGGVTIKDGLSGSVGAEIRKNGIDDSPNIWNGVKSSANAFPPRISRDYVDIPPLGEPTCDDADVPMNTVTTGPQIYISSTLLPPAESQLDSRDFARYNFTDNPEVETDKIPQGAGHGIQANTPLIVPHTSEQDPALKPQVDGLMGFLKDISTEGTPLVAGDDNKLDTADIGPRVRPTECSKKVINTGDPQILDVEPTESQDTESINFQVLVSAVGDSLQIRPEILDTAQPLSSVDDRQEPSVPLCNHIRGDFSPNCLREDTTEDVAALMAAYHDVPNLTEFIPKEHLPDILVVHDPQSLTLDHYRYNYKTTAPKRYKRHYPNPDLVSMPNPRVAHLYLRASRKLGYGHHSNVYRSYLHLPPPLIANSSGGFVTVAAKISTPEPRERHYLLDEGSMYSQFPEHLMEDWSGYNYLLEHSEMPTPVVSIGAVVPKFYGFYLPDFQEALESNHQGGTPLIHPSPILLLEACGSPVEPDCLSKDEKTECYSLFTRLHKAGFIQNSPYVRNVLVQPGPLDAPPSERSMAHPSFRLIDFGSACRKVDCTSSEWPILTADERARARRNLDLN